MQINNLTSGLNTDLEIQSSDDCVLLRPAGPQLNAVSAPGLKNAVVDLANQGRLRVILSLSRVEQIDSSGLGTLISIHKTLAPPRGRLVLCDLSAKVRPIFELTRLDRVFAMVASEAAARELIRNG